jgi:hypothetical protein
MRGPHWPEVGRLTGTCSRNLRQPICIATTKLGSLSVSDGLQTKSCPTCKVIFYRTLQGVEPVREWLQSLDKRERLQLGQAIQTLPMTGPALAMPYACRLGGGLFELRERVGKVRYRIFYAFDGNRVVVLLHAATKDQRVIGDDIALARRRFKDYLERRTTI